MKESQRHYGEGRKNESICYDNHISMMDHVPLVLAGIDKQGAGHVSCLGRCIWEPLLFVPGGCLSWVSSSVKLQAKRKALSSAYVSAWKYSWDSCPTY